MMLFTTFALLGFLATSALAAPATSSTSAIKTTTTTIKTTTTSKATSTTTTKTTSKTSTTTAKYAATHTYTATYDDISVLQGLTGPPNPYKGLDYSGFTVDTSTPLTVIQPQSGRETLDFTIETGVLAGLPSISAANDDAYYSFISFYYACTVGRLGLADLPIDCTILVTGELYGGGTVTEAFDFHSNSGTNTHMTLAVTQKKFWRVTDITFALAGNTQNTIIDVKIDTVNFGLLNAL